MTLTATDLYGILARLGSLTGFASTSPPADDVAEVERLRLAAAWIIDTEFPNAIVQADALRDEALVQIVGWLLESASEARWGKTSNGVVRSRSVAAIRATGVRALLAPWKVRRL